MYASNLRAIVSVAAFSFAWVLPEVGAAFPISQVNGTTADTASNWEAESVCNVSVVGGDRIETIASNDDNVGQQSTLFYSTIGGRTILPGASLTAWNVRVRSAGSDGPWTHHALLPPTDQGWAALWGDPSIASNLDLPQYVFLGTLAMPTDKFDLAANNEGTPGEIDGSLLDAVPLPVGGACMARSIDGGQTFGVIACVRDETSAGTPGDTLGRVYDGTAMAVTHNGAGGFSAFAGFIDTPVFREAIWVMDDVTSDDPNPFHPDTTSMGNTGRQVQDDGSLGEIETHVLLRGFGSDLWKMSAESEMGVTVNPGCCAAFNPAFLKVNVRDRNGNAVVLADNAEIGLFDNGVQIGGAPVLLRTGPQFDFDVGLNESNQPEMRFVYVAVDQDSSGQPLYYLQGGWCTTDLECSRPAQWRTTPAATPLVLFPAMKYGQQPTTNAPTWNVTFQGRDPSNPSSFAVFTANLGREAAGLQPALPLTPVQATPFQMPCPKLDGEWGDYDGMGFDPATGAFVRPYTDSSLGCVLRQGEQSENVHVSAVDVAPLTLSNPRAVVALTAGTWDTCAAFADGTAACWGGDVVGELGNGGGSATANNPSPTATPVEGLTGVTQIVAATSGFAASQNADTCALLGGAGATSVSTAACWGDNTFSALGDLGSEAFSTTPVAVQGLTGIVDIATGSTSCAVLSTGAVECWGENDFGGLGIGTTSPPFVAAPVTVPLAGPAAMPAGALHTIAAGDLYTCVVLANGSIQCWGANHVGQLGNGSTADVVSSPVTVVGISNAVGLAAGFEHTCALLADTSVSCWGDNPGGDVGEPTNPFDATPVSVPGVDGATSIAAGDAHSCAVVVGGAVLCWGLNQLGQLGLGAADQTLHSEAVPSLVTVGAAAVVAGGSHTCALFSDGTVQCWGENNLGQLGLGTTNVAQLTPTLVPLN